MNKAQLIEHIAQQAEISKLAAERAVDALVGAVKTSLRKGQAVTVVGFGTFYPGAPGAIPAPARRCRSPRRACPSSALARRSRTR